MNRLGNLRPLLFLLILAILGLIILQGIWPRGEVRVGYSDFVRWVKEGRVAEVIIKGSTIKGILKTGETFITTVDPQYENPVELLDQYKVPRRYEVTGEGSLLWQFILWTIVPIALLVAVWLWFMRRMQAGGGALSFAQSRAKLVTKEYTRVTFKDVAGIDEVIEEVKEIVDYLKNPGRFARLGARVPKGILLVGPPGTGKTLLARAIAGEANVPFFSISGSDFVEMFVGVGAARVRDMFQKAKQNAPCIIFIDEIDAVGRKRGAGIGGGHDEREQTLNQLLAEMDGFEGNSGVIVLAATNRPDVLDPALLRPGRFDRKIVVPLPDVRGRKAILEVHTRDKKLAPDVDLEVLAKRTPGFAGADLANLCNEAALLAARQNKDYIEMSDFEEALDRVLMGLKRQGMYISDEEKRIIAYHESGHALLSKVLPHADPVHKVTIIPRGKGALGATVPLPTEDRYILTKTQLLDRITMLFGGRAAEELVMGQASTGAQDDLKQATELAKRMVVEFGMSEDVGPLSLAEERVNVFLGEEIVKSEEHSEELNAVIDREIRRIVEECYTRARSLLAQYREALDKLAAELLSRETLDGTEIDEILAGLIPAPAS
ncbi:cell division protein FtsH [Candidatus Acetothermia bacterium]|nr:MAG: cell division protein FtsH [Candidatus Acetothermia bacterium]RLE34818.1 MAG: cell division protein FtsH [Candidatus Acetothermia bacterium]